MKISLSLVLSAADVERVRVLRNTGREQMTNDTREITQQAQQDWWSTIDNSRVLIWLCYDGATEVGFGMIRMLHARTPSPNWYVTLVVAPEHHGKGYGTAIYRAMLERAPDGRLFAEILHRNEKSIRAAKAAGFQEIIRMPTKLILAAKKED